MIAERSNEKLSLHHNLKRGVEYSSCRLSAINDAINSLVHCGCYETHTSRYVVNTKGEKDPCSISLTLSSYSLFLSSSCFLYILIWRNWHRIEQMG